MDTAQGLGTIVSSCHFGFRQMGGYENTSMGTRIENLREGDGARGRILAFATGTGIVELGTID